MYTIDKGEYAIIPVAYNCFMNTIHEFANPIGERTVVESWTRNGNENFVLLLDRHLPINPDIVEIENYVMQIRDEELVILDMQNVVLGQDHSMNWLGKYTSKMISLINLDDDVKIQCIEDNDKVVFEDDKAELYLNIRAKERTRKHQTEIHSYVKKKNSEILWSISESLINNVQKLDSSCVFCNYYVNVKKLFEENENYNWIIYQLFLMIRPRINEFDAIVCTSRNGANIACNLGWLVGKKVVYCMNLGPKFSVVKDNIQNQIKTGKKYLYIYDFICLGTEAKILNAIIGLQGAELIAGHGVSNYVCFEETKNSILAKMKSVVSITEAKIPYQISGEKKYLEDRADV